MTIFDHLSVGVDCVDKARAFYDGLMEILDINLIAATNGFAAYGTSSPEFLAMIPFDGAAPAGGNGVHIAFEAASRESVDACHKHAIANGGACEGEPGPRDGYPNPNVYTAYFRDPFGNKLEVIHNGFAAPYSKKG